MKKLLKYLFLIFICIVFTFCTSNTIYKKPENLIPKNQMAHIVTDMLIATGGKNIKNLNLERKINYFPLVFEKYKIDSVTFNNSNIYYTSRIDDYSDILKEVRKRLELERDSLTFKIKERDSLRGIDLKTRTFLKDSIKK